MSCSHRQAVFSGWDANLTPEAPVGWQRNMIHVTLGHGEDRKVLEEDLDLEGWGSSQRPSLRLSLFCASSSCL